MRDSTHVGWNDVPLKLTYYPAGRLQRERQEAAIKSYTTERTSARLIKR
jgi:hypothetical protein